MNVSGCFFVFDKNRLHHWGIFSMFIMLMYVNILNYLLMKVLQTFICFVMFNVYCIKLNWNKALYRFVCYK